MRNDEAWIRYDARTRRYSIMLHVQPGARANALAGLHGGALRVRIAAPAADNRANAALIAFLTELTGVAKSSMSIRHGRTSRRKLVEISGGPELRRALEERLLQR